LSKPYRKDDLAEAIRRALEGADAARDAAVVPA
jgi:FixJ family two-component response regulator